MTREYGFQDYGLELTDSAIKYIASQLCDDYTEEEYSTDPLGFDEVVVDKLGVEYICNFTGDAVEIQDDGMDAWSSYHSYRGNGIYYLPLLKQPGIIQNANHYKDIQEIVDEIKKTVGNYLPDDFDYRSNIKHIIGVYYG